ncbi:MAG: hypothetical protein QOE79_2488, partial [Sphingomonadales bacterium]|nr:hypothetical protein [Sphingomonadales bacterium]
EKAFAKAKSGARSKRQAEAQMAREAADKIGAEAA